MNIIKLTINLEYYGELYNIEIRDKIHLTSREDRR